LNKIIENKNVEVYNLIQIRLGFHVIGDKY